jgi:hypothetical protein
VNFEFNPIVLPQGENPAPTTVWANGEGKFSVSKDGVKKGL